MKLLTTVAIVAGLFGASTGDVNNTENYTSINKHLPLKLLSNKEFYGVSSRATPHIFGGKEAVPQSHPHQVYLGIKAKNEADGILKYITCGGSLLSESWVVTAAQCLDKRVIFRDMDANSDKIKLIVTALIGAHNIKELYYRYVQIINASEIIIHPQWSLFPNKNDIALLKLEKNAKLDEKYAKSIRLPKNSQLDESFAGSAATMTGWGVTDLSYAKTRKVRQNEEGRISGGANGFPSLWLYSIPADEKQVFSGPRSTSWYLCGTTQQAGICAGPPNKQGDTGGPLIVKEADGKPTLIGITSFQFGCVWRFPAVFTRITSYLIWILNTTNITPRTE